MEMCEVPTCPAVRDGRSKFCRQHRDATLANAAGCHKRRCVACKRAIGKDDYVLKELQQKTGRFKPGEPYGWQHVACEPPSPKLSKRAIRESEKPLLGDCDEPASDRGAA